MTDIASLGIDVEVTGIEDARAKLDAAGASMRRLGTSTDQLATKIGLLRDAQGRWRDANGKFVSGVTATKQVLERLRLEEVASSFGKLEKRLDPVSVKMRDLHQSISVLDASFVAGRVGLEQYENMSERLSAEMTALRASATGAVAPLTNMQRQINLLTGVTDSAAASTARINAQNSMFALGMGRASRQTVQYGTHMGAAAQHTTNLMFQLQDIGMMMAMGQNPLLTMAQQGTQVSGVFHQMRQSGMTLSTGIRGAFGAMLNSTSLWTMAAIGAATGAVYLAREFIFTGSQAEKFEASLDALEGALGDVESAIDLQSSSVEDIIRLYGEASTEVYGLIDAIAMLARDKAALAAFDLIQNGFQDFTSIMSDSLNDFGSQITNGLTVGAREIITQLGLAGDAAVRLQNAILDARAAEGLEEQARALSRIRVLLDEQRDALGRLPTDANEFYQAVVKTEDQIRLAIGSTLQLDNAMSGVADTVEQTRQRVSDLADEMSRAASNAVAMAANARSSALTAATQLRLADNPVALAGALAGQAFDERVGNLDGAPPEVQRLIREQRQATVEAARQEAESREALLDLQRTSTSSGGGGGRSSVDTTARELEREREAREEVLEGLRLELSLIGQTDAARRVANLTQRASVDIHSAEGQEISRLVMSIEEARESLEGMEAANDYAARSLGTLFSSALTDADRFNESLSNILQNLGEMAINSAFQNLIGGAGANPIASAASWLFGFSSGTPNTGGHRGEVRGVVHGQEAVIPLPSGGRVPVKIQGGGNQSGGMVLNFSPVVDARGADVAAVARLESALRKQSAEFGPRVVEAVRAAQRARAL